MGIDNTTPTRAHVVGQVKTGSDTGKAFHSNAASPRDTVGSLAIFEANLSRWKNKHSGAGAQTQQQKGGFNQGELTERNFTSHHHTPCPCTAFTALFAHHGSPLTCLLLQFRTCASQSLSAAKMVATCNGRSRNAPLALPSPLLLVGSGSVLL